MSSSSAAASTSFVAEANGSMSTIVVAAKPTGHHVLKIDGYYRTKAMFAAGKSIHSCRFQVGDHIWRIKYYPNGNDSGKEKPDYISLMLELDFAGRKPDATAVKAHLVFSLLDQDGEPVPSRTYSGKVQSFPGPSGSSSWGLPKFIYHDELENSENLKDDRFAVRCDVTVIKGIELRVEPASLAVPESDLHCHLRRLLSTGDGADITLKAGGKTFTAHRCVLAARSPVFKAALYGDMRPAAGRCIDVDDIDAGAFRALLHFVYTDTLPEMTSQDVPAMARQLIAAADKYQVERLKLVCEDKLSRCVDMWECGE
ncbi:hypothetical protein E2562_035621 [Oryza meyeriana var. granulata]|uniref:BTB domain-containing protein n=1 Tax=Oryza meyeriana var. granulata TaxID=110450 RepID=A0A6G1CCE4_9ORYZ|nr:hypothetical protein E2562_035621 [Oryza meyeriana var. granulata]